MLKNFSSLPKLFIFIPAALIVGAVLFFWLKPSLRSQPTILTAPKTTAVAQVYATMTVQAKMNELAASMLATQSQSGSTAQTQPASTIHDPIIFFVSDLVSVDSLPRAQKVVSLIQTLMAQHPNTQMLVASAGDNEQEETPTLSDYQTYFASTYGIFVKQGIFRPVRGNHDVYDVGHGQAYSEYFTSVTQFNRIHIDEGIMNYMYSYDLGAWHIAAIDQPINILNQDGLNFLKSDLAKYAGTKCQLVYWHVPTFSSGFLAGDDSALRPLNQAEYDAGVDIQINGHAHDYQRFNPIDPTGQLDNLHGITTFIVGIGGEDVNSGFKKSKALAASAVMLSKFPGGNGDHAIGTLMLTLHTGSADYALYDANNNAILDQGTVKCH